MERSLSLLAALSGPGRRAQPVSKAVGMLGWIGEAMAQVLRKVGEHARAHGRSLCAAETFLPLRCEMLVLHTMESSCRRVAAPVGRRDELPYPSRRCVKVGNFPARAGGRWEERDWDCLGLGDGQRQAPLLLRGQVWSSCGKSRGSKYLVLHRQSKGGFGLGEASEGETCLVTFSVCHGRALSKSSRVRAQSLCLQLRAAGSDCSLGLVHRTPSEFPLF